MTLAQTPRWTEMNISSIILYNWTTSPAKRENNLRRYRKLDRLKWIQHKISYENSCVRRCSLKMEAWNPKNKSWKSWKHFQLTFYFLASWKSHNIGGCTIPSKRCSFLHCQSQTATVQYAYYVATPITHGRASSPVTPSCSRGCSTISLDALCWFNTLHPLFAHIKKRDHHYAFQQQCLVRP